ncbi:MAG: MFS transporter permease [Alphaproteobacteria bacterium]|nr:MAG: MFS transporter permease [Alphaproteobacteria bacterium]
MLSSINFKDKNIFSYLIVTISYWSFMLTDGALRMLVLLHFHVLGFNPIQLAYLFLLYEFAGIITNLSAGWLASKFGLNITLYSGLILQIISLLLLTQVNENWTIFASVIFVMFVQGLSGVSKDLTKMSSKSAVKLLAPETNNKLFKWVSFLTGSKNTVKGLGFFIGGLLLYLFEFQNSLIIMSIILFLVLTITYITMPKNLGSLDKKVKFSEVFSKNKNINFLSASRVFLFGARDVWFVVGLPLFFYSILSDGSVDDNKKAFFIIGTFLALWIIIYGIVQALTPKLIKNQISKTSSVKVAKNWSLYLFPIPIILFFLLKLYPYNENFNLIITIIILLVFCFFFAINSSLHSFLILKFTNKKRVTLDVGFYYMSNAAGRLIGTLFSGLSYTFGGIEFCLFVSSVFLLINRLSINKLEN